MLRKYTVISKGAITYADFVTSITIGEVEGGYKVSIQRQAQPQAQVVERFEDLLGALRYCHTQIWGDLAIDDGDDTMTP